MSAQWFTGKPDSKTARQPVSIASIDREALFGAQDYDAEEGLADAVNTALLLDQPLLLTGQPGTGKTQLAEKLQLELGYPLFKFETRSTSAAQDLFYNFDHVARFQAAQGETDKTRLDPLRFVDFGALGRAIINSLEPAAADPLFPDRARPYWYAGPGRAIVLIDEIDKAPGDFSNDTLNEIERHYFRIREVPGGGEVKANPKLRPVVVITSNSEKQLPDAFLRRCIFYHLQDITRPRLEDIVLRRLAGLALTRGRLLDSVLDVFFELRAPAQDLRKAPSTAECLGFLAAVLSEPGLDPAAPLPPAVGRRHLSVLVKAPEDHAKALQLTPFRTPRR